MSAPESLYVVGCAPQSVQQDGTCAVPVWMPYHQPILPPLDLADGTLVAFSIVGVWAIGVKAKLVFRAARMGQF
jgi:hypothetical protein